MCWRFIDLILAIKLYSRGDGLPYKKEIVQLVFAGGQWLDFALNPAVVQALAQHKMNPFCNLCHTAYRRYLYSASCVEPLPCVLYIHFIVFRQKACTAHRKRVAWKCKILPRGGRRGFCAAISNTAATVEPMTLHQPGSFESHVGVLDFFRRPEHLTEVASPKLKFWFRRTLPD